MQEKRNKRLALLLFLWVAAILVTYWMGRSDDVQAVPENLFRDFDIARVDRVVLARGSDSVVLDYNGSRWRVNERFAADAGMIDVLFATLQQAAPRRPVSVSQQDSVGLYLKQHGVGVHLYSSGARVSQFIAGGNATRTQAYFLDPASGRSYLMAIPGYRVYVSGIFELAQGGWRSKRVFDFNWRNFGELEVQYPQQPNDNFQVAMENDYFGVRGMEADTTRLNDFLDAVSLLYVTEYTGRSTQLDSLEQTAPLMTIAVRDVGQRTYQLDVFSPRREQDVYPARIDGSQWAYLDQESVRSLLRTRQFFKK